MIYIAYMGFFLYLCRMKYFIIDWLGLLDVRCWMNLEINKTFI